MGNKRSFDDYTIANLEHEMIINAALNEHFAEEEYMEVFAYVDAVVNEPFSEEENEDIFASDDMSDDDEIWNIINNFLDENEDFVNELVNELFAEDLYVDVNEK